MKNYKNIRNKQIHIRVSDLEKQVIRDKAELLGLSITDYIIQCCVFSSVTDKFIREMYCIHTNSVKK